MCFRSCILHPPDFFLCFWGLKTVPKKLKKQPILKTIRFDFLRAISFPIALPPTVIAAIIAIIKVFIKAVSLSIRIIIVIIAVPEIIPEISPIASLKKLLTAPAFRINPMASFVPLIFFEAIACKGLSLAAVTAIPSKSKNIPRKTMKKSINVVRNAELVLRKFFEEDSKRKAIKKVASVIVIIHV